jgi:DNA-binding CsgD family transcriptional regulator
MFDAPVHSQGIGAATPASSHRYAGPERRREAVATRHWHSAALDAIDYGIVLVGEHNHVVHGNRAAHAELASDYPLQVAGGELRARSSRDAAALREALDAARLRGLRRLLTIGEGPGRASLSVVPLAGPAPVPQGRTVLLVLGKRRVCEALSMQGFARSHQLTDAETRVLVALCEGRAPQETAAELGVAISTVRTQIASIRMKTGAASIGDLVRQMAVLPPLTGLLRAALPA